MFDFAFGEIRSNSLITEPKTVQTAYKNLRLIFVCSQKTCFIVHKNAPKKSKFQTMIKSTNTRPTPRSTRILGKICFKKWSQIFLDYPSLSLTFPLTVRVANYGFVVQKRLVLCDGVVYIVWCVRHQTQIWRYALLCTYILFTRRHN